MSNVSHHNRRTTVTVNQADVAKVKALLGDLKDKYKNVMATSINKTLTTAKTQAAARINNELNLKSSRIKDDFRINKASHNNLSGALISSGKPVGLIQFGARQTAKGVTVKVKRSSSRSLLRHAFIAKGKGDSISKKDETVKKHVFWRGGNRKALPAPKRFPMGRIAPKAPWNRMPEKDNKYRAVGPGHRLRIERKTGPRIEDIFAKPKVLNPIAIQAQHVYLLNIEKKIDEIIRRHNG